MTMSIIGPRETHDYRAGPNLIQQITKKDPQGWLPWHLQATVRESASTPARQPRSTPFGSLTRSRSLRSPLLPRRSPKVAKSR